MREKLKIGSYVYWINLTSSLKLREYSIFDEQTFPSISLNVLHPLFINIIVFPLRSPRDDPFDWGKKKKSRDLWTKNLDHASFAKSSSRDNDFVISVFRLCLLLFSVFTKRRFIKRIYVFQRFAFLIKFHSTKYSTNRFPSNNETWIHLRSF